MRGCQACLWGEQLDKYWAGPQTRPLWSQIVTPPQNGRKDIDIAVIIHKHISNTPSLYCRGVINLFRLTSCGQVQPCSCMCVYIGVCDSYVSCMYMYENVFVCIYTYLTVLLSFYMWICLPLVQSISLVSSMCSNSLVRQNLLVHTSGFLSNDFILNQIRYLPMHNNSIANAF